MKNNKVQKDVIGEFPPMLTRALASSVNRHGVLPRWYEMRSNDKPTQIGVDMARMPDKIVIASPCLNCGVFRTIENGVMEKCPNCGDDETDLNEEIQIP